MLVFHTTVSRLVYLEGRQWRLFALSWDVTEGIS